MPTDPQHPRTNRLVVGITGRIGAGKTSAAKYLASQYGFQYLRYSLILSEWLATDSASKAKLQEVGWKVMTDGMQAELNRRLAAKITPEADVVVDGFRHPIDVQVHKDSYLSSFRLVYIDSPATERWKRLEGCGRYQTFATFEEADLHPVEQKIESLRIDADFMFSNEGSLEDLYLFLDKTIRKLRPEGNG